MRPAILTALLLCLGAALTKALPVQAETWALQAPRVPFDYTSGSADIAYEALDRARGPWRLCVAYPHMKDAYWLSVNYGMVVESRRLGVSFRLVEAGGYPNLDRQIEQIEACVGEGVDALVVGGVSFDGLSPTLERIARRMPVIAAVNDIADAGVTAKAGVSWTQMGAAAGRIVAKAHPAGSAPVKLAWFPGPRGAGWVDFVEAGFRAALADSSATIVETKYGDTGREIQVLLVEQVLEDHPDIDYIVGSAPTAEAAVSVLRARGMQDRVTIVSDYMTHAVYRGIRRGRIAAAPTDFPVLQGRLAIEMAVRAIEGSLSVRHAGPRIQLVDRADIEQAEVNRGLVENSLAPASFVPVFETR